MSSPTPALQEPPITFKPYIICAFAAFGGILFRYDSGYISGVLAMDQFKLHIGSPGSTDPRHARDTCTRRGILGCLMYIAGVILQVAANFVGLLTGRPCARWVECLLRFCSCHFVCERNVS